MRRGERMAHRGDTWVCRAASSRRRPVSSRRRGERRRPTTGRPPPRAPPAQPRGRDARSGGAHTTRLGRILLAFLGLGAAGCYITPHRARSPRRPAIARSSAARRHRPVRGGARDRGGIHGPGAPRPRSGARSRGRHQAPARGSQDPARRPRRARHPDAPRGAGGAGASVGTPPITLSTDQFNALVLGLPWQRLEQLRLITRM